jgi:hypothetical protein
MATLNDLVNFIESNPQSGEFYKEGWEKALDQNIPDWKDIIKDPNNWSAISRAKPRGDYYSELCELFINSIGIEFAKYWFYSPNDDQSRSAERWLTDYRNLTSSIWNCLDCNMKEHILNEFTEKRFHEWHHIEHHLSYATSGLKTIIETANDYKFLNILNNRIENYLDAI